MLSLVILAMGGVTSYARAKADVLGYDAKVGIAERADRLVALLVPAFFADLSTCRSCCTSRCGCSRSRRR